MLTKNRVKIAEGLELNKDIWEELRTASVIDEAGMKRIKVLIKLKYLTHLMRKCFLLFFDLSGMAWAI